MSLSLETPSIVHQLAVDSVFSLTKSIEYDFDDGQKSVPEDPFQFARYSK